MTNIDAAVAKEQGTKAARAAADAAVKRLNAGASFDEVAKELHTDGHRGGLHGSW